MEVVSWDDFVSSDGYGVDPIAATVGVFDGVHLGHRRLLRSVVDQEGARPAAVTFAANPKAQRRGRSSYGGDLSTLNQKLESLAEEGIDLAVLIDFSGNFSRLTGKQFVGLLRDRGRLRYLAVGQDFRCGYRQDTDASLLVRYGQDGGYRVDVVPPVLVDGGVVSSSRIRAAVAEGGLVEARRLLGRDYEIDLSAAPITPGKGGDGFAVRSTRQVLPPPGRYAARLRKGTEFLDGIVTVEERTFFVSPDVGATRAAFVSRDASASA